MNLLQRLSFLLLLLILSGCAEEEDLGAGTVDVKNMSVFFSIKSVYLKQSTSTDWGSNRLANAYLGTTDTVTLTGLLPCNTHWDFKTYFSDSSLKKTSKFYLSCGGVVTFSVYY